MTDQELIKLYLGDTSQQERFVNPGHLRALRRIEEAVSEKAFVQGQNNILDSQQAQ